MKKDRKEEKRKEEKFHTQAAFKVATLNLKVQIAGFYLQVKVFLPSNLRWPP